MSDIEVKRKELETAKRIRVVGYDCRNDDEITCFECTLDEYGLCRDQKNQELDAFISTREAELAALEETPHDGVCPKCLGEGFYYTKGATTMEAVKRTCECQTGAYSKPRLYIGKDGKPEYIMPIGPTLDDFALALIQGGYFNMTMGEDAAISNLVSRAEKIKAALDARRGA